jgi:hypothetical protein
MPGLTAHKYCAAQETIRRLRRFAGAVLIFCHYAVLQLQQAFLRGNLSAEPP